MRIRLPLRLITSQHRAYATSAPPHAIITGASRGIGLSIATHLAQAGYTLTLIARDPSRLSSAASNLPPGTETVPGDVSSPAFWADLAPRRVDVLVNAAGITYSAPFVRADEGRLRDVVETNLLGTMWGCRAIGRRMLRQTPTERGRGVIVNVGSLLGVKGGVGTAAYAASKAGVVGLTRALAAEMGGAGVRVNAVLPGYVSSDMTDAMTSEAREKALSSIPLKRFGTPDEVADAALFLINNAYAHNCVLNLDGGVSATVCVSK